MKLSSTRWLRFPEICAALLLAASTLSCVSASSYDAIAEERDQLREKQEHLEQASQGADKARVQALGQREDLREERDRLALEVKKLGKRVAELETALKDYEHAREAVATRNAVDEARFGPVRAELDRELNAGQVRIAELPDGLQVMIAEELLFAPGSGELTASGRSLLQRLALRVRDEDERVEVEGAADTPPLRLARGAAVMRALAQGGVPNEQLRAGSFASEETEVTGEAPLRRGAAIRLLPNLGAGAGASGVAAPSASGLASPALPARP